METNFRQRFEIIYKKYSDFVRLTGSIPSESGFARYVGAAQPTMHRWKGGQIPGSKDLKAIHDKLGFSYDWLISGEGVMFDEAAKALEEQRAEIARLEAENQRLEAENQRLTTRLFMEGDFNEESAASTGKAAGQK